MRYPETPASHCPFISGLKSGFRRASNTFILKSLSLTAGRMFNFSRAGSLAVIFLFVFVAFAAPVPVASIAPRSLNPYAIDGTFPRTLSSSLSKPGLPTHVDYEMQTLVRRHTDVGAKIRNAFKKVGSAIKKGFQKVGEGIKTAAKAVGHFAKTTLATVAKGVTKVVATIESTVGKAIGFIPGLKGVGKAIGAASKGLDALSDKIPGKLPKKMTEITNKIQHPFSNLKGGKALDAVIF